LELLKEILPKLNRVAILRASSGTGVDDVFIKEAEVPARALGVKLVIVKIQGPDDFDDAFRSMTKERANGLVIRLLPKPILSPSSG
jgi:putative tryptophan/tyrosine transport system substrate-binding protein